MLETRLIPVLLIHKGALYKTIKFRKPVYVGDPVNAIKIFNEKEVDELIILDIDSSKSNKEPNYKLIEKIASQCFMPICYGGGVKSIKQMQRIFALGVEKITLNSCLLDKSNNLLETAIDSFGSQSIVASVNVKKNLWGEYRVYDHIKGKATRIPALDFIQSVESANVGEVFISDVDNDGLMQGFNIELFKKLTENISVPTICCGGAGSLKDVSEVFHNSGISAVSAGSIFVFKGKHRAVLITYPKRETLNNLFKVK